MKANLYITLLLTSLLCFGSLKSHAQEPSIENVVLVHGAFADRSGWQAVYNILKKKGYDVSVVQIPLTSLKEDVAAVNRALDRTKDQVVLVGHSWSGTVITEAGLHDNVAALVYVDAFQPDQGESTIQWIESEDAAPENAILPPDDKGFVYIDREGFRATFAADLPLEQTNFMADSQQPIAAQSFAEKVTKAAWHKKPSFGIIGTQDKSINPKILHAMYQRSHTPITEIQGASHAVFLSHPKEVAQVIIKASKS